MTRERLLTVWLKRGDGMKLTKEQAITEHRKMWRWIAEETEKRKYVLSKRTYLYVHFGTRLLDMVSDCFLCEYVYGKDNHQEERVPICDRDCPINWGSNNFELKSCSNFHSAYSPYVGWYRCFLSQRTANNWVDAAKYARQIAELPERVTDTEEEKQVTK